MPFKIILQPIDAVPRSRQTMINEDPRVKSLFAKLQDFITADSNHIDAEIRRLTIEKSQRRQQAEKDFKRLVALIESAPSTSSTKMVSEDDIESLTPPVTPESNDKMSIDDHLSFKNPRDGHTKHNSAIGNGNPRITRVINFEDNIFELEGMQEDAPNEGDQYHKYSDTEDEDLENIVEKRAMRGRSGSINIARSAPISMPLFAANNHTSIDIDEIIPNRAVNELHQMDIASSIKILARSVHQSDAVFGELPARRCNKF